MSAEEDNSADKAMRAMWLKYGGMSVLNHINRFMQLGFYPWDIKTIHLYQPEPLVEGSGLSFMINDESDLFAGCLVTYQEDILYIKALTSYARRCGINISITKLSRTLEESEYDEVV